MAPDLHNQPYNDLLPILKGVDAILAVGDMVNRYHQEWETGAAFLKDAAKCAPTFVSVGNHERHLVDPEPFWDAVSETGAVVLNNTVSRLNDDVILGGFSSQIPEQIDPSVVQELDEMDGFRLLMCHHPEYFPGYIQSTSIDLTVAGHAHGGQCQLFGHGLYSPGQGIFPRFTDGLYCGDRLLVSRGLSNLTRAPRLFNPCELVLLQLQPY